MLACWGRYRWCLWEILKLEEWEKRLFFCNPEFGGHINRGLMLSCWACSLTFGWVNYGARSNVFKHWAVAGRCTSLKKQQKTVWSSAFQSSPQQHQIFRCDVATRQTDSRLSMKSFDTWQPPLWPVWVSRLRQTLIRWRLSTFRQDDSWFSEQRHLAGIYLLKPCLSQSWVRPETQSHRGRLSPSFAIGKLHESSTCLGLLHINRFSWW